MRIIRSKRKNCTTCKHQMKNALDGICYDCMMDYNKYGHYSYYEPNFKPKDSRYLIAVLGVPKYGGENENTEQ